MRKGICVVQFALCAIMLLGCERRETANQSNVSAQNEIEALLDSYEKCVSDADTTLLFNIWSEDRRASFVNPFERIQSVEGLIGFWYNFLNKSFSKRDLKRKNVSIHTSGDFAWAVFDWDFAATLADGKPFQSSGWETQVYHKTDRGWRIVHVHYSVPLPSPGFTQ